MEQFIAVEVWMALVGASCITGWLIGDWNGSERMRRLIGSFDSGAFSELEPLALPAKPGADRAAAISAHGASSSVRNAAVRNSDANNAQNRSGAIHSRPAEKSQYGQSDTAFAAAGMPLRNERSLRSELPLLTELPVLSELRAQAEAIRCSDRVWDHLEVGMDLDCVDATSARILNHYHSSIQNLHQINRIEY